MGSERKHLIARLRAPARGLNETAGEFLRRLFADMREAAEQISATDDLVTAAQAFVAAEDALLADLRAKGELPELTEQPWSLVDAMRAALSKALPNREAGNG